MRVISMNGETSVPFEYAIIMVEDNQIVAVTPDAPFHRLLAKYSTHEEAKRAFLDMHHYYQCEYTAFQFKEKYNV